MQSGKIIDSFEVCKWGMLCLNFYSVTVYDSAVMEFCPFLLKQRIKLILKIWRGKQDHFLLLCDFLHNSVNWGRGVLRFNKV